VSTKLKKKPSEISMSSTISSLVGGVLAPMHAFL
jgi:hypothetical protein